jgi:NnrU protein
MAALLMAALFFDGIHFFVAGTGLRGKIVGKIGEEAFQGLFSLLSLVGIFWLSRAYGWAVASARGAGRDGVRVFLRCPGLNDAEPHGGARRRLAEGKRTGEGNPAHYPSSVPLGYSSLVFHPPRHQWRSRFAHFFRRFFASGARGTRLHRLEEKTSFR